MGTRVASLLVACLVALPARAGAASSQAPAEEWVGPAAAGRGAGVPFEAVTLSGDAAFEAMGMAVVDGGGSVETWRGRIRGGLAYRAATWSVGAIGEEEWVVYDSDAGSLPGWPENARIDRLSVTWASWPGGDWSFFGSATASVGVGAGDGKWSQGIAGGGALFGRRQVTPRFAWLVGLLVYDRLGGSLLVVPVPGVEWKITPRLGFVTGRGAALNYRLDRQGEWRVNGSVLFDATVCAVDAPGGGATLRDERVPVTMGVEYRAKSGFRIQGYGGVVAWRRWELDAGSGDDAAWRGDPGVVFGLEGGTTF